MPDVVKHAWTHRPKAQGGTDPIEITVTGGGGLPVANMSEGENSRTTGSKLKMTYGQMWTNDTAVFGYSNVTSGKAKYMTLKEDGVYRAVFQLGWVNTFEFTLGDNPSIAPATEQSGVDGDLVPALDDYFDTAGAEGVWNSQRSTEMVNNYHVLTCEVVFSFIASMFGETPMKVGCSLYTDNSRTADFKSQISVVRLSPDVMSEVTIT